MLLSEYIRHLQTLLSERGDYNCQDAYGEDMVAVELNTDDPEDPVYVLADKA